MPNINTTAALVCLSLATGCAAGSTTAETPEPTTGDVPAQFAGFASTVQLERDGSTIIVRSTGIPNHRSPYFATSDARYEGYQGTNQNFVLNPNRILEQGYVFRIPVSPTKAGTPQATPLGPIGVSINGVPIFNQYAAGNAPLTNEINSFDHYNGHPQQTGAYHYHVEPLFLTAAIGRGGLLGFLLDGFPVYGPVEGGRTLVSADLDAYHGHEHVTGEYPQGIYHYHVTADAPYINGSGFRGVPGTVSR